MVQRWPSWPRAMRIGQRYCRDGQARALISLIPRGQLRPFLLQAHDAVAYVTGRRTKHYGRRASSVFCRAWPQRHLGRCHQINLGGKGERNRCAMTPASQGCPALDVPGEGKGEARRKSGALLLAFACRKREPQRPEIRARLRQIPIRRPIATIQSITGLVRGASIEIVNSSRPLRRLGLSGTT
jgi:hypothetical protein